MPRQWLGGGVGTPTLGVQPATKAYVDGRPPGITSGSGTGSRPASPVAGQSHWRTDKNFMEVYDGAAWRVPGTVVVSATTDITDPVVGQQVINVADEYRRWAYSGATSGWVPINDPAMTGQAIGAEWLNNGAAQNIAISGATKLLFPTRGVGSGNGITVAGGGGNFTNEFEGLYFIDCQIRLNTSVAGGVSIGLSSGYTDGSLLLPTKGPLQSTWGDQGVSGPIWLAAGTTVSAYFYNNTTTASATSTVRAPRLRIWGMFAG